MSSPLKVRMLGLALLVLGAGVRLPAAGTGFAQITLNPATGPPTTVTKVKGIGFGTDEKVRITLDGTWVGSATSTPGGTFTKRIRMPSTAQPGEHRFKATGLESGLSAKATFIVRTNWPMFRFAPDHLGVNPYENVLSTANVRILSLLWARAVPSAILSSPTVADGVLYIGDDEGGLTAMDAATGAALWHRDLLSGVFSSPAVADGTVFVKSKAATVYALDTETGDEVWSTSVGSGIDSSPTVVSGVVYVGGDQIYALDADTGKTVWDAPLDGSISQQSPTVTGGVVYASSSSEVVALDAATGQQLWQDTGAFVGTAAAVSGGRVFVGYDAFLHGTVIARDAATGAVLWHKEYPDDIVSSPAVWDDTLYFGSEDSNLYAVNAVTGRTKWTIPTGDSVQSSPAIANGVVYFGSFDDTLYAADAVTGELLWSYATGGSIGKSSPAVADGMVFVGSFDFDVYAFALPADPSVGPVG